MMDQTPNLFGSSCSLSFPSERNGINRDKPATGPSQPALSSEVIQKLAARYGDLLDRAVEQRAYKSIPAVSTDLREFSVQLGCLQAGARDVIELHNRVLDGKLSTAPRTRMSSYLEEGRLLVLELMGYLLSYYRMQLLQASPLTLSSSPGGGERRGTEEPAGKDRSAPPGANRGADHG